MWRRISRTVATATPKVLLPQPSTGSNDIESFPHFEFLAHLREWTRTEMHGGNGVEINERPHYFALRIQISATDFYRILTDANVTKYYETVRAFETHCTVKPVLFNGGLARGMQHPSEK